MKLKTKLVAFSLFAFTTATVAYYPTIQQVVSQNNTTINKPIVAQHSSIEVVFVLDTTGSMSGMIDAAKQNIWSIVSTMASTQNNSDIRVGLVAYRDRGDEYITQSVDLSKDLDSMYAELMDFQADGGGDGPESVNQALSTAVNKISWSQSSGTYKVVFLVGDAPAHMDYAGEDQYPTIIKQARQRGITINTIQAGQNNATRDEWQQIAQLAQGDYLHVEQAGSAVAITTPFDDKLATLSAKLDETKLYYGDKALRVIQKQKLAATKKLNRSSSSESRARRAEFNISTAGKKNFLGEGELVDDITSGRVELDAISVEELPEPMHSMAPKEQQEIIKEKAAERDRLKQEIGALAKQRSDYLRQEMEKSGKERTSLDYKIFATVKAQAEAKGIHYDADAVKY